jgi:hypothetical protein
VIRYCVAPVNSGPDFSGLGALPLLSLLACCEGRVEKRLPGPLRLGKSGLELDLCEFGG